MSLLYWVTFTVNLLALVLAIWLGLYLISHSPRNTVAWLTALMLWFLGGGYLNVLLAMNPPPVITLNLFWLRLFFPFWPQETLSGIANNWLQGWSIFPAIALWHHVTVLLLPGETTRWRMVRILLGYVLAVIAIIVQSKAQILFNTESSNPLYLNSLRAGPWYPIFAAGLFILICISAYNLIIAARNASALIARKQLLILAWAVLVVGLVAPVSMAGSYFGSPIPMVVISILLGVPVGLIAWSVARYSALIDVRINQKDFIYNLVLLVVVLLVYLLISWSLLKIYHAPPVILVIFPLLAVITHSSMTVLYRLMDRLFYKKDIRSLRQSLRQLSRMVGVNESLETLLEPSLVALCTTVSASFGLILVFENNIAKQQTAYRLGLAFTGLDSMKLIADDVVHLQPGQLPGPLADASLLVPLYAEENQLGALVLGRPLNGLHYSPEDIDQVQDFADHSSETILVSQRNSQYLDQIDKLVQAQKSPDVGKIKPVSTESLEFALRNLYDYSSLADNPLAELKLVQNCLPGAQVTHLDRGKALHAILLDGLEKLRPSKEIPTDPPPREWYPYLILHKAYLNQTSNRDIMQTLYISEGTFNRTRRAAIRSLARALGEMEAITA